MSPEDLDARVLAAVKAGHGTAKEIAAAEGINATAAKNALSRLEYRGLAVTRNSRWRAL